MEMYGITENDDDFLERDYSANPILNGSHSVVA